MNSTNIHDKERDALAQAWYDALDKPGKRRVDEWAHRVYMAAKFNPQSQFSERMAREVIFSMVLYAVNEPKCERC